MSLVFEAANGVLNMDSCNALQRPKAMQKFVRQNRTAQNQPVRLRGEDEDGSAQAVGELVVDRLRVLAPKRVSNPEAKRRNEKGETQIPPFQ